MFGTEEEDRIVNFKKKLSCPDSSLPIQNTISLKQCFGSTGKLKGILKSNSGNYVSYSDPGSESMDHFGGWISKSQNKRDEPYFLSPSWSNRPRALAAEDDYDCSRGHAYSPSRSSSLTRRLLLRTFQLTSLVLITLGIVTLVTSSLRPSPSDPLFINGSDPRQGIHEALESWMLGPSSSPPLLDLPNFFFILNNRTLCSSVSDGDEGLYFMVLVHSAPDHFAERQAIRTTWGSVRSLRKWSIRLVFLLGSVQGLTLDWVNTQEALHRESGTYGDLVSGPFEDTYRNLTLKHLMGYRWAVTHCPGAKFILKTDDDAFIDIFQLFDFTVRTYGPDPRDVLLCNVYPEGTKPVRLESSKGDSKWIVTQEEYPFEIYPKYCGGLGYLATPDVAGRILGLTTSLKRLFWIDDVFVTGVMRELVRKEPHYLNLRYSYDVEEYRRWLEDRSPQARLRKIPFMFVHVERGGSYSEDMARLWRKTLRAWS